MATSEGKPDDGSQDDPPPPDVTDLEVGLGAHLLEQAAASYVEVVRERLRELLQGPPSRGADGEPQFSVAGAEAVVGDLSFDVADVRRDAAGLLRVRAEALEGFAVELQGGVAHALAELQHARTTASARADRTGALAYMAQRLAHQEDTLALVRSMAVRCRRQAAAVEAMGPPGQEADDAAAPASA